MKNHIKIFANVWTKPKITILSTVEKYHSSSRPIQKEARKMLGSALDP